MISVSNNILTSTVNTYTEAFNSYLNQFLNWGEWLFFGFLVIALVWLCVWNAFDKNSMHESMPNFLREFFVITFFYSIMLNAGPWLNSMVQTAVSMGETISHERVDPSSIIEQGLTIANDIYAPSANDASYFWWFRGTRYFNFVCGSFILFHLSST